MIANITIEIEVEVDYDYQPEEESTNTGMSLEVNSVMIVGTDIIGELTGTETDYIWQACLDNETAQAP